MDYHVEASTPKTFHRFTMQTMGATFGTKFEGLAVSMDLPKQIAGLYHAGSVGIIMSGWLGAINYGVIVANEVETFLGSMVTSGEFAGGSKLGCLVASGDQVQAAETVST